MTSALSKPSAHGDARRQPVELAIARHLRALFECLPTLAQFRVRTDLMVADVSALTDAGNASTRRLHVSVMQAIVEWAECDPEAVDLMRGRTFVRHH
jgi:hypothetical protein